MLEGGQLKRVAHVLSELIMPGEHALFGQQFAKSQCHSRLVPIEDDFPAITRTHHLKRLLKVSCRVLVRENRIHPQSTLQHGCHLIPSFEHLSAINALQY